MFLPEYVKFAVHYNISDVSEIDGIHQVQSPQHSQDYTELFSSCFQVKVFIICYTTRFLFNYLFF